MVEERWRKRDREAKKDRIGIKKRIGKGKGREEREEKGKSSMIG